MIQVELDCQHSDDEISKLKDKLKASGFVVDMFKFLSTKTRSKHAVH